MVRSSALGVRGSIVAGHYVHTEVANTTQNSATALDAKVGLHQLLIVRNGAYIVATIEPMHCAASEIEWVLGGDVFEHQYRAVMSKHPMELLDAGDDGGIIEVVKDAHDEGSVECIAGKPNRSAIHHAQAMWSLAAGMTDIVRGNIEAIIAISGEAPCELTGATPKIEETSLLVAAKGVEFALDDFVICAEPEFGNRTKGVPYRRLPCNCVKQLL